MIMMFFQLGSLPFHCLLLLLALASHRSVHALPIASPSPAPPREPTFSVGGAPISTSPYFNGQHIYGNAPNVPKKPINTIIAPNQQVDLQRTPSGNLQSTHPVAVQEFRHGVPQPPRQGVIRVSEGRYGDINHFAGCYRKRSPGACGPPRAAPAAPVAAAGGGGGIRGAAGTIGRYAGRAASVLGGPWGTIASTAVDNGVLGYQTSSKYNEKLRNGGRDYEAAHAWKPPSSPAGGGGGGNSNVVSE